MENLTFSNLISIVHIGLPGLVSWACEFKQKRVTWLLNMCLRVMPVCDWMLAKVHQSSLEIAVFEAKGWTMMTVLLQRNRCFLQVQEAQESSSLWSSARSLDRKHAALQAARCSWSNKTYIQSTSAGCLQTRSGISADTAGSKWLRHRCNSSKLQPQGLSCLHGWAWIKHRQILSASLQWLSSVLTTEQY